MKIDIVRGKITNPQATDSLISTIKRLPSDIEGTLFLNYLLRASDEEVETVDALFVSKKYGLIAIMFSKAQDNVYDEQDKTYYQLDNTLKKYNTLRSGRSLAFTPNVVTFFPKEDEISLSEDYNGEYYNFASPENLLAKFEDFPEFNSELFPLLQEALHKISSMKPKKNRSQATTEDSLGYKIKIIEKEIANLDIWQKKAAFEIPEGPQRVRGLAGSGKTIVLALKAAYLHAQNPDWNIAVTYYTRSLGQQFKELITKFSFEFMGSEPDFEKLSILHSWGTESEPGIYADTSISVGLTPYNFNVARAKYDRNNAFGGICGELLTTLPTDYPAKYDALLIDEAQDMPIEFFKLCYRITKDPKRIVFAYDELQNLTNDSMPEIEELFGKNEGGEPIVNLKNLPGEAQRDIVLPICYRNTRWALTLAHALGFGIYRKEGLVQFFKELDLWEEIGYRVSEGVLDYNSSVKLKRKEESSPEYFDKLISPDEAIELKSFNSTLDQYKWVAEEIKKDVSEQELDYDDILVIFPDAYYSKSEYMDFRKFLTAQGINSILAGVTSDRDVFRVKDSVTCSSIYRAKGNEAPKVYIINAEHCSQGPEMIKLRNTLFTAITRSRGWVKVCGVGPEMEALLEEARSCIDNDFSLELTIPTIDKMERLRLIHGEKTEEEKQTIHKAQRGISELNELINSGKIDPKSLPELMELLKKINEEK